MISLPVVLLVLAVILWVAGVMVPLLPLILAVLGVVLLLAGSSPVWRRRV